MDELISLKAITYCSAITVCTYIAICVGEKVAEGGRESERESAREGTESAPRALHMCRRVQKSGEKCNLKAGELCIRRVQQIHNDPRC